MVQTSRLSFCEWSCALNIRTRDKASGAQKRYEDKIKERKKAEIEAKKAAIRAEDIARGVFVPVSSLPQREPMKGVQTA